VADRKAGESTSVTELAAAIAASPSGREVAAFFDFDGTLITGYSAAAFYRKRLWEGDLGWIEAARTLQIASRGVRTEEEFAAFLELSLASLRGKRETDLREAGERLFRDEIGGALHRETWELVRAHRAKGHRIVIASSATRFQVGPAAREIDADHVICTELEEAGGRFTGKPKGILPWGEGKAAAVRRLAKQESIDLARSFAYANGVEDVAFLATAGHPVAVEPAPGLFAEASRRGWPVLRCVPRGGRPPLESVLRTIGFYGSMAAAATTGMSLGLLNGSLRLGLDLTTALGTDLGLAVAGVEVNVVSGAEHLWSSRPAVFVFNHQSKIDPILIGKLLRGGFTGVAKKEARNVPGFGLFFELAGVAFVDRGNTTQALKAIEPAVRKVREERVSLAISPEGTRSPSPRLGPFKKGAFHIAMAAGVPMVPIVIRNAGEVMWRSAQTIRAGTVDVAVLPPVDTSRWRRETIGEHVRDVRDAFVRTLGDWPDGRRRSP
jgi:putative phosphoserine phosphatase / 1-acylglycerol-3-phosphate O-acyltransferase